MRVARSAGARPKPTPVATATATAKASFRGSSATSRCKGTPSEETRVSSRRLPQAPNSTPSAPPIPASSRLSVSSWRTRRRWPAPIPSRTAISRRRPSARASSRFATLAQAISSTRLAAPVSISSGRVSSWRQFAIPLAPGDTFSVCAAMIRAASGSGWVASCACLVRSKITPSRAFACRMLTSGRSRPSRRSQWTLTWFQTGCAGSTAPSVDWLEWYLTRSRMVIGR